MTSKNKSVVLTLNLKKKILEILLKAPSHRVAMIQHFLRTYGTPAAAWRGELAVCVSCGLGEKNEPNRLATAYSYGKFLALQPHPEWFSYVGCSNTGAAKSDSRPTAEKVTVVPGSQAIMRHTWSPSPSL